MSDEDKDVDSESDDDEFGSQSPCDSGSGFGENSSQFESKADKRAHHNALERKRRDQIKDSFSKLRDAVPTLQDEKPMCNLTFFAFSVNLAQASRSHILNEAVDYIQFMGRKNNSNRQDIDGIKRKNKVLEEEIRTLEKSETTGSFSNSIVIEASNHINLKREVSSYDGASASDTSDNEDDDDDESEKESEPDKPPGRKKLKTSPE